MRIHIPHAHTHPIYTCTYTSHMRIHIPYTHAHSTCACTCTFHMRMHIPYAHTHPTCAYTSHIHMHMHIPHAHAHPIYTCTFHMRMHKLHLSPTQYIRSGGRRGLPAFRRLLGRPILRNIQLQDVVFAAGRGECVDALAAADRTCASNTSELDAKEKQLQKRELQSVCEG